MEERSPPGRSRGRLSYATLRRLPPTPPRGPSFHFPKDKEKLKEHVAKRRRIPIDSGFVTRFPIKGTKRDVFTDVAANNFFTTTGTVYIVNDLTQGTEVNQRIGRQVRVKRIYLSYYHTASPGIMEARALMFYDKQPPTAPAVPVATEIFDGAAANQTQILAPMNFDNLHTRFEVLYDNQHYIASDDAYVDRMVIDCDLLCTFGAIGNVPNYGAIWLYLFGNNNSNSSGRLVCCYYFEDQ